MFEREPVAIAAVVRLGLLMLVSFGFNLSVTQIAAVMAFTEALLAVIIRQSVTPMATLPAGVAAKIANENAAKP